MDFYDNFNQHRVRNDCEEACAMHRLIQKLLIKIGSRDADFFSARANDAKLAREVEAFRIERMPVEPISVPSPSPPAWTLPPQ